MSIQTIVFDFGNVIGFFDHRRALERLQEHSALTVEGMRAFLYGGRLEDDYESNRISSDEFLRLVREGCRLGCPEDVLAAAYVDIFWPNPEVCDLLPRLKPRFRLLLGSNTTALHSRQFRRQFADVLKHFDAQVLSCEIGTRKPAKGFFDHCQRLADCAPHECLFIDDLAANVAGAQACGWQGIVYTGGEELRKQLALHGILTGDEVALGRRSPERNGP
jgi:glucose-1-phosphatase